jgi:hypothetical protein
LGALFVLADDADDDDDVGVNLLNPLSDDRTIAAVTSNLGLASRNK